MLVWLLWFFCMNGLFVCRVSVVVIRIVVFGLMNGWFSWSVLFVLMVRLVLIVSCVIWKLSWVVCVWVRFVMRWCVCCLMFGWVLLLCGVSMCCLRNSWFLW